MNSYRNCCLFFMLLMYILLEINCTNICDSPVVIKIQKNYSNSSGCIRNNTATTPRYTCSSLDNALHFIDKFLTNSSCNVSVLVSKGEHLIHHKNVHIKSSVKLLGYSSQSTTVKCVFPRIKPKILSYTISFDHSIYVKISDLSMQGCPIPIGFDSVNYVYINNIVISDFTEAALEIYNCQRVHISNSLFMNNRGNGLSQLPFRGNTGAVSIGIDNLSNSTCTPEQSINVTVENTRFINNSAYATGSKFRSTSHAFFKGILTGRAGGMGVFVHEDKCNATIQVSNCVFENNFATSYGGGLYYVYSGNITTQEMTGIKPQFKGHVTNCTFTNNGAGLGAGGFIDAITSAGSRQHPHLVILKDCQFQSNYGGIGGAIYHYIEYEGGRGNSFKIQNTNFTGNRGVSINQTTDFGSAIAASIYYDFKSKIGFPVQEIENCTFIGNTNSSTVINIGYIPFTFSGTNVFANNTGASLTVIGAMVSLQGVIKFTNNLATEGGAIRLVSYAQIRLVSGLKAYFIENKGRDGASIFVDRFNQPETFVHPFYNKQCFLLNENDENQVSETNNVSMVFRENVASFGAAFYVKSSLSQCSWVIAKAPYYYNESFFPHWPIFNITNNTDTGVADSFNQSHAVVTNAVSFSTNLSISAWPGMNIKLNITSKDQLNGYAGTSVRLKSIIPSRNSKDPPDVDPLTRLRPNVFYTGKEPLQIEFQALDHLQVRNSNIYISVGALNTGLDQTLQGSTQTIVLIPLRCPGGYTLSRSKSNPEIKRCYCERRQSEVIQCVNDQDTIIIKTGKWAVNVPDKEPNLHFYTCPPDYCRCFYKTVAGDSNCAYLYSNSDPGKQCTLGRHGTLCGECDNGMVRTVLLDKCTSCDFKLQWFWFIILVFVDVVIISFIVFLDKPMASWIYPFIFWLQITPLITLYFPPSFSVLGNYLYFASSLIGFYLPYDFCLDEDLNGVVPHVLRLFAPLFAVLISFTLLSIFYYIRHLLPGQHLLRMHGIWTVMLFVYTNMLYNAMRILHCPTIDAKPQYSSSYRWYLNGSIECFKGNHLILTCFGILVLLLLLVLTIIIGTVSLKKDHHLTQRWIGRSLQAICYHYKPDRSYWVIAELLFRIILVSLIVFVPGNTVCLILGVSLVLGISSIINPYRYRQTNWLQTVILSLMVVLLCLESSKSLNSYIPPSKRTINSSKSNYTTNDVIISTTPQDIILLIVYYAPLAILIPLIIWRVIRVFNPILYLLGLYHHRQGYHPVGNHQDHHPVARGNRQNLHPGFTQITIQ